MEALGKIQVVNIVFFFDFVISYCSVNTVWTV